MRWRRWLVVICWRKQSRIDAWGHRDWPRAVSQVAASVGVTESSTNAANAGADSGTLTLAAGTVSATTTLALTDTGLASPLTYVELRSPVRQNDQATLIDMHVVDVGSDVDGDGKHDAGDVAIYRLVVGAEDVVFRNLPTVHAVRVDTIAIVRFTLSSTGKNSDPIRAVTLSTWYAPGLGVVRQTSTTPTDGPNHVIEETLLSFDAGTHGFGALAAVTATTSSAGVALPGEDAGFVRAFVVGDRALVFTQTVDPATSQPTTQVSRMDQRGVVLDTQTYAGLSVAAPLLVGLTDGALGLEPVGASPSSFLLTRWDATGHAVAGVRSAALGLRESLTEPDISRVAFAADGSTLWAVWTRVLVDSPVSSEVVARSFDLTGQPLTPEIVVATLHVSVAPELEARAGRVLISWVGEDATGIWQNSYAVIDHDVLSTAGPVAAGTLPAQTLTPFLFDSGGALVLAGESTLEWNGLRLGAGLTPLTPGATFQVLSEAPPTNFGLQSVLLPARSGNQLSIVGFQNDELFLNDSALYVATVAWVIDNGGPLDKAERHAVRSSRVSERGPYAQLTWPDRTLLFEGDQVMTTTLFWLNSGAN